ncbi:4122_t:CDS:2 [Entrophospora sp. SA101]|nr:4122_t:CDS:2 [Entrophospora sp. SA101]CAJ0912932.1 6131_t:CDS:2 [Entrophospora sp. SA101]
MHGFCIRGGIDQYAREVIRRYGKDHNLSEDLVNEVMEKEKETVDLVKVVLENLSLVLNKYLEEEREYNDTELNSIVIDNLNEQSVIINDRNSIDETVAINDRNSIVIDNLNEQSVIINDRNSIVIDDLNKQSVTINDRNSIDGLNSNDDNPNEQTIVETSSSLASQKSYNLRRKRPVNYNVGGTLPKKRYRNNNESIN